MTAGLVLYNHGCEVVTARDLIDRAEAAASRVGATREREPGVYMAALAGALETIVTQLCRDLEAAQTSRQVRARIAQLTGAAR
jgi:hypothetical protein